MTTMENKMRVVAGAGGGGESGRTPVEDQDSLQSRALISILDLLGEGQIGGLVDGAKSIYFNDTPLQNPSGTFNFEGVATVERHGTINQTPIDGFAETETPTSVGVQCKSEHPVMHTVTNPNADAIRVIVTLPSLMVTDSSNGDMHGTRVEFKFDMATNGDGYKPLGTFAVDGKCRSRYQRSYKFRLPKRNGVGQPATRWTLRMTRVTPDSDSSLVQNETYLDTVSEVVESKLSYPHSALVGVTIDSARFSSIPTRSYLVDGLLIQVPSNYDPDANVYEGIWDGTFKLAVSSNPAWVLYALITHKRYGLGQFIAPDQVNKAKLYQIGRHCDELVDDGFGGKEKRFEINTQIQQQAEAYKLIADVAAVFRGMAYWAGGAVSFTADMPTAPSMEYSPANVVDGHFSYAGTARKDRHSVVLVSWCDPEQNYRQVVEYVEDAALVAKWGVRQGEITAFGCTSRGQAHRVGRWMLYTEAFESDFVSFGVGLDSAMVLPGDVVRIHDPHRAGKRMGGRLKSCAANSAELDSPIDLTTSAAATISLRLPSGEFVERQLKQVNASGPQSRLEWQDPLPVLPVAGAIWMVSEHDLVPLLARVVNVAQGEKPGTFTIQALEHNPSKFAAVESGMRLERPPTSIIDGVTVVKPSDLRVVEVPCLIGPGLKGLNLEVSWSGNGIAYDVTWRREGKYTTNWETVTTTQPLISLENVRAGDYHFLISAVGAFGKRSETLKAVYATIGRTAAPGDVANFRIVKRTTYLELRWDDVTDIDLAGYEIRVGPSWDEGEVLTAYFNGTMFQHDQDFAGTYPYHIRSIGITGEYSDNVTTVELVLNPPATPEYFDAIQSGGRLELRWRANKEPDIAYYEVREGSNWASGVMLGQVKGTTMTVPAGAIGSRKFWIKSVASPGIYCDDSAWVEVGIVIATNANIIVETNERELGWPGRKIHMKPSGYDLIMADGVGRCEYIMQVDLLEKVRAQNSLYGVIEPVVSASADKLTWEIATFPWDHPDALRGWALAGNDESVKVHFQIAREVGLRAGDVDGWRLDGSLASLTGKLPSVAIGNRYEEGRYGKGLRLKSAARAVWSDVNLQPTFKQTFWLVPQAVGNAGEQIVMRLSGSASAELLLVYDEPAGCFVLSASDNASIRAPLAIAQGDVVCVAIVQTADERKLMVGALGGEVRSASVQAMPVGPLNRMSLGWT